MRHIITLFARSLVLTALVVASQCVCAQKWNAWVAVQALDSTINAHQEQPRMLRELAEDICKKGSHQPNVVTGVARAFLHYNYDERLTEIGMDYLNEVLAKHPDYAPAYVLMGNLYMDNYLKNGNPRNPENKGFVDGLYLSSNDDDIDALTDSACYWYQRAIDVEPTNPIGYENYATQLSYADFKKRSQQYSSKVEEVMQKCAANVPNYSFEWGMIRCLEVTGFYSNTLNYYNKLDITTLSEEQLEDYARRANDNKKWEDVKKVSEYGMSEYPENHGFKEKLFRAEYFLRNYDRATELWQQFSETPSYINFSKLDSYYAGVSYKIVGNQGRAEQIFKDLIQNDTIEIAIRSGAVIQLASLYTERNDFDLAENLYKGYLSRYPGEDSSDKINLYLNYAQLFFKMYDENNTIADNINVAMKGDSIISYMFSSLNKEFLSEDDFRYMFDYSRAYNQILTGLYFQLEGDKGNNFETQNGRNSSEKILQLLTDVNNPNPYGKNEKTAEKVACRYLGFMYYVQKQKDLAIKHLQRYIELEEEGVGYYNRAKEMLSELQKPARRRRR